MNDFRKEENYMIKKFYNREWSLEEKMLLTWACILGGMVVGFLFSPIKKGVYCGNHNGNTQKELE